MCGFSCPNSCAVPCTGDLEEMGCLAVGEKAGEVTTYVAKHGRSCQPRGEAPTVLHLLISAGEKRGLGLTQFV